MGKSGYVNKPTSSAEKFTVFNSYEGSQKWFNNPDLSNSSTWPGELTPEEKQAVGSYTGTGYGTVNSELYNVPWEEMSSKQKEKAANIYNALNKFELKKGITVTRQSDFQIFGASEYSKMTVDEVKNYLSGTKGIVQNDGFLSTSANNKGAAIEGSGLVVTYHIPPSKGAGAYVNPISHNAGSYENEFLINNNAVFKFDVNSIHMGSDGKIHATAEWLGQAKNQSLIKKSKKKKGS